MDKMDNRRVILQIIQNILKEKLYKWSLTMHIFIIRFIVDGI